jgi:hypothetical protein
MSGKLKDESYDNPFTDEKAKEAKPVGETSLSSF